MLSRALQKAHTAVVLDNAQNFEGAISAYGDACELLQQVLVRSSGEDDRRKLDSIRTTYTNRIQELHQLRSQSEQNADKSLPQPPSDTSPDGASPTPSLEMPDDDDDDEDDPVIIETAVMTRVVPDMSINPRSSSVLPDLLDSTLKDVEVGTLSRQDSDERFLSVESPMDASYLPPPLSPRRTNHTAADPPIAQSDPDLDLGDAILDPQISNETSVSWLDTIDESGGSSCASSVHSLTLGGLHRKHIRVLSGDTEAEFDAALDAAVEAAYDDGFEPYDNDHLAENRAVLSMRSESLGEDAYVSESSHEARGPPGQQEAEQDYESESDDHMEDARGYIDGFDFGLQSKSAPPRQSDSSTFSGNTWHSSISSSRTAATSLSTVAETVDSGLTLRANGSLPRLSEEEAQRDLPRQDSFVSQRTAGSGSGVRSRRMSGQNAKQLKIETAIPHVTKKPLPNKPEELGKPDEKADEQLLPSSVFKRPGPEQNQLSIPQTLTPLPAGSPVETAVTVSPATPALSFGDGLPLPASPGGKTRFAPRPLPLKKNKSSISLKNRTLSMSSPDGSDASLGTPMSTTFSFAHRGQKPASNLIPMISTPSAPTFATDIVPNTGVDLFESDLHSPYVPGTPNPLAANAPIPLEPCPDSHLLRPFWLMRCFYQTIAHPRGGYLSTKLFVPRDVWRVKGVKIKAVDDKISTCDLLTAALLKLASVDTLDADAVLDEMQAFEALLDQAQSNLSKKLGNDVGAHGLSTLFKDGASADGGNQAAEAASASSARTASTGRSYLTSWRKLRSKGSAVNLTSVPARDTSKDTYTMSTVPVTTLPNPRFAKRDLSQLDLSGPHALYMGSLARLFDAAQIIDQITRQAEDPGLKHSSPTHVGLELSTKRASDFFGFYVCRFVLQDLSMLLDKFIKRGSEWVLV
ncbi:hypothetical protein EJ06DRAFT_474167 [Trichodelitschia bisporula]|uniref:MIT domain-containing protein n=1 Tax=Trichodelitschia bisporula TaxID=703511 RepID=A0A6G1I2L5_9PEZI|nr:hypothetical protein EJ06DRAFT_474167 [Trichodelitschia bisporula]